MASENGFQHKKSMLFPSLTLWLDTEEFEFIPAPKQSTRSLKTSEKFWSKKVEKIVDKTLSCTLINRPKSETLTRDKTETKDLLWDFKQQLRQKSADVPLFLLCFP